ncbi:hypothetical protein [uncultured Sphingomonas sp.]|uniref:hypothetical protein n=1 Tax=uncultured Sphingomonas sp. TaxID=158754 RepID=UPI0030D8A7BF
MMRPVRNADAVSAIHVALAMLVADEAASGGLAIVRRLLNAAGHSGWRTLAAASKVSYSRQAA